MGMQAKRTRDPLVGLSAHLDEVSKPFTEWLTNASHTSVSFVDVHQPLLVGLGLMQRLNQAEPEGWKAVQLAEALEHLDGPEYISIKGALLLYTNFLIATDRWTGGAKEGATSMSLLQAEVLEATLPTRNDEPIPDPSGHDTQGEADGLAGLPIVGRLRAVLDWLGEGREVSADGDLVPADVAAVAELLGETDGSGYQTMWDSPTVAVGWSALRNAALIDTEGGRAVPASLAAHLDSDNLQLRLESLRQAVTGFVLAMLDLRPAGRDGLNEFIVQPPITALARAVAENPVSTADLDAVVDGLGRNGSVPADEVADVVAGELAAWAASGVLRAEDGVVDVPPSARPAVAAALVTWDAS